VDSTFYPNVRVVKEERAGSYVSRNTGVSVTRGEILAFTDADCLPRPNWLSEGVRTLGALEKGGAIAGKIAVCAADARNPRPAELYGQLFAHTQERYVRRYKGGATANLFCYRDVFNIVGGFDPEFRSWGDLDFTSRIVKAGYRLEYAPGVVVDHPARRSLRELVVREARISGGWYDFARVRLSRTRSLTCTLRLCLPPVRKLWTIATTDRLSTLGQRVQLAGMAVAVHAVFVAEQLRRRLGGSAVRR
jgi:cellulose synthase/poly-beta-1,6-N-acetylglucosamine synthase-like glycosyltransferase